MNVPQELTIVTALLIVTILMVPSHVAVGLVTLGMV